MKFKKYNDIFISNLDCFHQAKLIGKSRNCSIAILGCWQIANVFFWTLFFCELWIDAKSQNSFPAYAGPASNSQTFHTDTYTKIQEDKFCSIQRLGISGLHRTICICADTETYLMNETEKYAFIPFYLLSMYNLPNFIYMYIMYIYICIYVFQFCFVSSLRPGVLFWPI